MDERGERVALAIAAGAAEFKIGERWLHLETANIYGILGVAVLAEVPLVLHQRVGGPAVILALSTVDFHNQFKPYLV